MSAMQRTSWMPEGEAALRRETHYGDRQVLCYANRPSSLSSMLAELVDRFGERPMIVESRTLTFREFDGIVDRLARGLARWGVGPRDRVAMIVSNRWEFLATLFACVRLGAVAVPIGVRQQRPEVEFLLNDCEACALIVEDAFATAVPERDRIPSVHHVASLDGTVRHTERFDALLDGGDPVEPADASEEDTVLILYTSGTTGKPKGALLTHLGVIHSSIAFARRLDLGPEDRALVAAPLSHVTGLVGVALTTLSAGGSVVLMRGDVRAPNILDLVGREGVTYSILVPALYTLIAMSPELDPARLSSWRVGCFGGAPMPVSTIEALAEKLPNLALVNAYGATETTSPTTIMPLTDWREHIDSVGTVVPCGHVRVVDENGADVAPGEAGELWIAGPMVVPGYYRRPEANRSDFVDGYWRSGDVGSMDRDGFVRVLDRRKDMLNRAGFKVYSAEVEDTLSYHPAVLECAIVGRPDPVLGERVHAFIVPAAGASVDLEQVRSFCATRLSDYKVPESITVLDRPLPRNNNGKIQKPELRQRLLEEASPHLRPEPGRA